MADERDDVNKLRKYAKVFEKGALGEKGAFISKILAGEIRRTMLSAADTLDDFLTYASGPVIDLPRKLPVKPREGVEVKQGHLLFGPIRIGSGESVKIGRTVTSIFRPRSWRLLATWYLSDPRMFRLRSLTIGGAEMVSDPLAAQNGISFGAFENAAEIVHCISATPGQEIVFVVDNRCGQEEMVEVIVNGWEIG